MSRSQLILAAVLPLLAVALDASSDRIAGAIDPNHTTVLPGRAPSRAQARFDLGRVDPAMPLEGIAILLRPDPTLDGFLRELHTPGSPNYRKFLTPEQFGERFGASPGDLPKIRGWLESQGLKVTEVARGRHWIMASGTAGSAARAFHTEFHHYRINGERHFANSISPSVPAALGGMVAGIYGLHDFRPQPLLLPAIGGAAPEANSGSAHYLTPDDFATIFDVQALYAAGIDGSGQSIAVAGQTALNLSDISSFRSRFNLPASAPQLVLIGKNPGNLGGDELAEADLDIEWSGAVAPNANIIFVYSSDAFTSAQSAIDQNLAPVLTISFGTCELDAPPGLEYVFQQADAQGITVLAASGDQGPATCDAILGTSSQQSSLGPTATFPAGVPEVTALGGTTLTEGSGTYWASSNDANGGSALSYIPESTWNDTIVRDSFAASGGAASVLFPQPAWQAGPGVPVGGGRSIPDVSLPASPQHDGYEVYTGGALKVYGGTSVSSPAFAGVVALLNQQLTSKGVLAQAGLGNINPDLYRLGQSTSGIFHDVTQGSNQVACVQASPGCFGGLVGYDAGPGYDLATGWGSVDVNNFVTQWNSGGATTTNLSATPSSAGLSDAVQLTATVTGGGSAAPTGTVTFLVADASIGSVTLSGGAATLVVTGLQLAAGNGTVTAAYSGDTLYDASGGTTTVAITPPAKGSMVIPAVSPNPVYASVSSSGSAWYFTVTLTNASAVATTLTSFTIGDLDESTQITRFFGSSKLNAHGSFSASLGVTGIVPPDSEIFKFSGSDTDGTPWSQFLAVAFEDSAGPPLFPAMTLTGTPGTVVQNPQADPACQWAQQLTVQNQSGFPLVLGTFSAGATNLNSSISRIFGSNRLAAYGTLQGTYCASNVTPPAQVSFTLTGTSIGETVSASASASLAGPASNPGAMAVSPTAASIPVTSAAPSGSASLSIQPSDGQASWSITIVPVHGSASWLTVTPLAGAGPAQVSLAATGSGLSSGVYQALLVMQAPGAIPPSLTVPVALVVGASTSAMIAGAANNASNAVSFAPGEQIAVYGAQLAPAGTSVVTSQLPLPLIVNGVTAAVNGVAAPFYYASPGQINIQVPYEAGAGPAVLSVNNNGQVAAFPLTIAPTAPGIYGLWTTSGAPAAAAPAGSVLVAYITGEGDVTPSLATGATPSSTTAVGSLPHPRQSVSVTVGGVAAATLFAGIPSGLVGVTQVNFTLPANAPLGSQPVVVTVGGVASPAVSLNVTAAAGR